MPSLLSEPFWGRLVDNSSRRVMLITASIAALTSLAVCAADCLLPARPGEPWFLPLAYFVLNIGHNGIRVGLKTYVVDLGSRNLRTDRSASATPRST